MLTGSSNAWRKFHVAIPDDMANLIDKFMQDRKVPDVSSTLRLLIAAGLDAAELWDQAEFAAHAANAKAWCIQRWMALMGASLDTFHEDADLGGAPAMDPEEMERAVLSARMQGEGSFPEPRSADEDEDEDEELEEPDEDEDLDDDIGNGPENEDLGHGVTRRRKPRR